MSNCMNNSPRWARRSVRVMARSGLLPLSKRSASPVVVDDPRASLTSRLAADRSALLPDHRLAAGAKPPSDPRVLAATSLGENLWLAVLDAGDLLTGPLSDRDGILVRATPGDGAAACLVQVMASGELPNFNVIRTDATVPALASPQERAMSVDQTHESVVVGEALVVKWSVAAERSPAPSLITHLTEAGFDEMPATFGFVTWEGAAAPVVVASVMEY